MKLNSAFFSSLLVYSLMQLAVNADARAAQEEKPERWFEIEVILFKQLNDKATLKEQFPDNITATNLPEYQQYFDLLNPYLQPNLTHIKQFVPLCGEQNEQQLFLTSLQNVSTPFPEQIAFIEQKTEQAAVDSFTLDFQEEALAKPIFSTQNICIISASEIKALFDKEQLTHFKLDSFGVDHIPNKLNASGIHISDSPYLIVDQSLLLKDISQRLGWSKEFRPLLHFGWRQIGITKSKAIPLKLFAGEHLEDKYQQALTAYRVKTRVKVQTQDTVQMSENINRLAVDENNIVPVDNELKLKIKHKQQALNELFTHLDNINKNQLDNNAIDVIVMHSERQTLEDILTANKVETVQEQQVLDNSIAPKKPLQPWFLDGFIKVHLDRYLYITADFNVLSNHQIAKQSNPKGSESDNKTSEDKLINFSQNKRVISGEIHYFDHPYIGMIVQIRRFDPSKPADEAVTQAIK